MKKFYFLLAVVFASASISAQHLAFDGSDFEDFAAFEGGLNNYGLKSYAVQGAGEGMDGSNSLSIETNASNNDYVFTATAPDGLPNDIKSISFYIKGTSPSKSISINLYKAESGYYKYNVGDLSTEDLTLEASTSNQYTGTIDTQGEWRKVTLNIEGITDYTTATDANFFAFKIGKQSDFNIDLDNFYFVSQSLGTVNLNFNKSAVKVAVNNGNLVVEGADVKNIEVYNVAGQKVAKSTYVGNLAKGVYIAVVEDNNGNKTSVKFIK